MIVLTHREGEVLMYICRGNTQAQVAHILGISPRTIKAYMESIRDKCSAQTNEQAVYQLTCQGVIKTNSVPIDN